MAAFSEEDEVISEQLTQQVEDLSINNDMPTLCASCGMGEESAGDLKSYSVQDGEILQSRLSDSTSPAT